LLFSLDGMEKSTSTLPLPKCDNAAVAAPIVRQSGRKAISHGESMLTGQAPERLHLASANGMCLIEATGAPLKLAPCSVPAP